MFRNLPSVLSPVDWTVWGERYPEPARAADRSAILELVARHEGAASADIAAHWFERQRDGFVVIREPDGTLRGFLALLDLTAASAADRAADPGAQAAWQQANSPDAVRAGRGRHPDPIRDRQPGVPGTVPDAQRHPRGDPPAVPADAEPRVRLPHPRRAGPVGRLLRARRPAPRRRAPTSRSAIDATACSATTSAPFRWTLCSSCGPSAPSARTSHQHRPGRPRCWCCHSRTSPTPCAGRCTTCTAPICWRGTRCCARACCGRRPEPRIHAPRTSSRCSASRGDPAPASARRQDAAGG